MSSQDTCYSNELCQFKDHCSVYLRPKSKNYESVDAILPPARVFQRTVGLEHGIKSKGLNKILTILAGGCWEKELQRFQFYFVVPEDIFPAFRKVQNYLTAKGQVSKSTPRLIQQYVDQCALRILLSLEQSF